MDRVWWAAAELVLFGVWLAALLGLPGRELVSLPWWPLPVVALVAAQWGLPPVAPVSVAPYETRYHLLSLVACLAGFYAAAWLAARGESRRWLVGGLVGLGAVVRAVWGGGGGRIAPGAGRGTRGAGRVHGSLRPRQVPQRPFARLRRRRALCQPQPLRRAARDAAAAGAGLCRRPAERAGAGGRRVAALVADAAGGAESSSRAGGGGAAVCGAAVLPLADGFALHHGGAALDGRAVGRERAGRPPAPGGGFARRGAGRGGGVGGLDRDRSCGRPV